MQEMSSFQWLHNILNGSTKQIVIISNWMAFSRALILYYNENDMAIDVNFHKFT